MPEQHVNNFQICVGDWMKACFGPEISKDKQERNHRFLEEALELVQATNCTREEAHMLVDYVFDRPRGEPVQELGGVMVTLAALSNAQNLNMDESGWIELHRVWQKLEAIREKQKNKPRNTPLPQAPATPISPQIDAWEAIEFCCEASECDWDWIEKLEFLDECRHHDMNTIGKEYPEFVIWAENQQNN